MDEDIKSNGCGVKNIVDVENSQDFLKIFQTFYQITGRLPLANGLLIVPDGEAPPVKNKVNIKNLYEVFRHTRSHGLVSWPFLGALHYYLNINEFKYSKNALTELYQNLSYITLIGARNFEFNADSDLVARISYMIKRITLSNNRNMEIAGRGNAYQINNNISYVPRNENPLDVVIDILDEGIEHKKTTHPYVPPQVQTAPEIEREKLAVDNEFADLKTEYDKINDVAT